MTEYMIKSSLCLLVLLSIYHLFLEKEKMHLFNRFYLLFAIVFSFIIPFITIEIVKEIPQTVAEFQSTQSILPEKIKAQNPFNYILFLGTIYCLIILLLSIRFIRNILKIYTRIKTSPSINYRGVQLILLEEKCLPHTFLNAIFINKNDYQNRIIEEQLYAHELTHVRQKHTLDILFIEIVKTVFWFNPLFTMYKKAIQLNHEFLADEKVVASYNDIPFYQQLLLSKAKEIQTVYLASNLNYSVTKKRLIMMTKKTSASISLLKQLALLPLFAALVFFLCTKTIAQEIKNTNKPKAVTKEKYYENTVFKLMDRNGRIISTKKYSELTPEQIKQLPATYKNKDAVSAGVIEWAIYNKTSDIPAKKAVKTDQVKFPLPKVSIEKIKPTRLDPEQVYTQVTDQPEYPGGLEAFYKYLGENFKTPSAVKEKTKVIAQFIIEKDGNISNITIIKDPGFGTGEETIRVLKDSPKWTPGKVNGEAVRVMYALPISIAPKI